MNSENNEKKDQGFPDRWSGKRSVQYLVQISLHFPGILAKETKFYLNTIVSRGEREQNKFCEFVLFCSVLQNTEQNRTPKKNILQNTEQNRTRAKNTIVRVRYFHGVFRTLLSIKLVGCMDIYQPPKISRSICSPIKAKRRIHEKEDPRIVGHDLPYI